LSPLSLSADSLRTEAFRQGLRKLGYIEGQNITIEYRFEDRYAEGKRERASDLAADLVRLHVDVIVVGGETLIHAARNATSTIPIVIAYAVDPVAFGFVA